SLIDGQSLSSTTGAWTGTGPISYGYRWKQCNAAGESCKEISGASASALSLISGEVGSTMRVVVTATNSAGSTSATSAPTGLVSALLPSNTTAPSVAGVLQTGQLLTALTGTWAGTPSITYSYQWQLCSLLGTGCANIAKATNPSFLLGLLDVGLTLRVGVVATNAAGSSTQVFSPVTGLIAGLGLSPVGGPASGGTSVTISGAGVNRATAVHFGSTEAGEVEVKSPTEITAQVPSGSGTVPVTVTVPEGTTAANPEDQYTYR
ncbi:MAG TPA: IPT/TIG domain-containing protein, partial [Solirubrobacteraceae bacterium]